MIDAKAGALASFAPLLADPGVVKVLHDCREDASALLHQHGVELTSVFDTQVRAGWNRRRARTEGTALRETLTALRCPNALHTC